MLCHETVCITNSHEIKMQKGNHNLFTHSIIGKLAFNEQIM